MNIYKSWTFIVVQAVLIGLILLLPTEPQNLPEIERTASNILKLIGATGLLVTAINLGRSLTVLPDPKKLGLLQVKGLYKYARHPMYTSVLLLMFGIASGSRPKIGLWLCLVLLFYLKAKYEEGFLLKKYKAYDSYMKTTPMFLPTLFRSKK